MHEFSIATGVVDIAVEHAGGRRVTTVTLRVGALRQVVPATLARAFELAARATVCEGAHLEQEVVSARLLCPVCEREWALEAPDFRCPTCEGAGVVVAGHELEVESIEVEDEETESCTSAVEP